MFLICYEEHFTHSSVMVTVHVVGVKLLRDPPSLVLRHIWQNLINMERMFMKSKTLQQALQPSGLL